jgi:hypothetical protein
MNIRMMIAGAVSLLVGLTPVAVSAQEATAPPAQYSIAYVAPSPEMMQTRVELAMGFTLTTEEARQIAENGCVVGPMATTTRSLYAWAAKKRIRPCTPAFYKQVGGSIGKESTLAFRAMAGADGFEYCPNMKVANLGNNRESCRTYPYNPAYNNQGQVGKYADVNWATGGGTMTAQIGGAVLGGITSGMGAAATGALLQKQCKNCGTNIQLGAYAEGGQGGLGGTALSNSESGSLATANLQAVVSGGTGSCATCGPPASPGTSGSGHTYDGPGSAPYNGGR